MTSEALFRPSFEALKMRKSPACRKILFGPVDHEESKRYLADLNMMLDKQEESRWNYDFKNDSPLPGRYSWERLQMETNTPVSLKTQGITTEHSLDLGDLPEKSSLHTQLDLSLKVSYSPCSPAPSLSDVCISTSTGNCSGSGDLTLKVKAPSDNSSQDLSSSVDCKRKEVLSPRPDLEPESATCYFSSSSSTAEQCTSTGRLEDAVSEPSPSERTPLPCPPDHGEKMGNKRKQSLITDYFTSKKKRLLSKK